MKEDGSELLAILTQRNADIVRQHPEYTQAEYMAAAALSGYKLGAAMMADTIRANVALRMTGKRQA